MWDFLKGLGVPLLGVLLGLGFLLLGITSSFTFASVKLQANTGPERAAIAIIGSVLVLVGGAAYYQQHVRSKATTLDRPVGNNVSADHLLHSLDAEPGGGVTTLAQGAVRFSILGRTAVNLLSQYRGLLEGLLRSGCEIHVLFYPSSQVSPFLYGSTPEAYEQNLATAQTHLSALTAMSDPGAITVKMTKHPPMMGMVIIEHSDFSRSVIQVQLYFVHAVTGRDRPVFMVRCTDKWYDVFRREFNELWREGELWT